MMSHFNSEKVSRVRPSFLLGTLLAFACLGLLSRYAAADNLMASGAWNVGTNWETGVPTSSDFVRVENNLTVSVPVGVSGAVDTMWIGYDGSGSLTINGGTVNGTLADIAEFNTGTVTVTSGTWTNTDGLYIGYSGTGALNISGGTVTTASANIWHGTVTVSGSGVFTVGGGTGTLDLASVGNSPSFGTLNLGTGTSDTAGTLNAASVNGGGGTATVNFNHTGDYTFAPSLTGNLSVNQLGSGTTTLTKSNTYTGGTTLNAGQLNINHASAIGTGMFTINGGAIDNTSGAAITLANNNAQQWNNNFTFVGSNDLNMGTGAVTLGTDVAVIVSASTLTVGGDISDGGNNYALTKIGAGTLLLTGSSNFGRTFVAGGVLAINGGNLTNNDYSVIDAGGTAMITSGTWVCPAIFVGMSGTGTLNINGGTVSSDEVFFGGTKADSAAMGTANVTGGTLNISDWLVVGGAGTGTLNLSGSGVVTVGSGAGTLTLADEVGSVGTLNLGTGIGTTAGTLNAAYVTGGDGTGAVNFNHTGDYTFAPSLIGTLNVNQLGDGTTTLTGTNTYTGSTSINNGALTFLYTTAMSNGPITVAAGATIGLGVSGANAFSSADVDALFAGTFNNVTSAPGSNVGIDTTNGDFTYATSVAGSPALGLVKLGANTLTLTGSSTYTGATSVQNGTLQIGDGVTVGTSIASSTGLNVASSGNLIIDLPSGTPFAVNGTVTSAGDIFFRNASSAGSVNITSLGGTYFKNHATAGNSQITLSGTQAWLEFANSSTAGNAQITTTGNAYLFADNNSGGVIFRDSSSAQNAHITLSSTGGGLVFTKRATAENAQIEVSPDSIGVLFLDNASGGNARIVLAPSQNTYTSVVDISMCNLGATLGSVEGGGHVYLGSQTLAVGGNDASVTFSGVIADGGLIGILMNKKDLPQSMEELQSPVMAGYLAQGGTGGSLIKTGTGVLNLTGSNTYTGRTTVQSGALLVNGFIASEVTVGNGGLLGGSGTIGNSVTNYGIVSPGNSPGTLTINGNYTQMATGSLTIQIASPTVYDQLVVGGTATLGGTLQVSFLNGYTPSKGDIFNYITAAHLSGTFSNINTGTLLGLQPSYLSTGTNATLQIVDLTAVQGVFADVRGLTPNQRAVAKGLDKVVNDPRVSSLVNYLDGVSLAGLPQKLEKIVPTDLLPMFDASIASAQVQASNLERRMEEIRGGATGFSANGLSLSDSHGTRSFNGSGDKQPIGKDGKELAPAPVNDRWGFFINGSGEFVDEQSTAIARGTDFTTGGITTGADYRLGDHAAVGMTAGYANTSSNGRGNGPVKIDSGKLGFYGTVFDRGFFLNGAVGGGLSSFDTKRDTLGGLARGDANGSDFNALLGTGYTYRQGGLSAGPIASVRYSWAGIERFTERGSLAPLIINDQSEASLKSTAGLQASYAFTAGKSIVTPQLRAQWQHEYLDTARGIGASFLPGGAFTVYGPAIGRDSMLLDAGVNVQLTRTVGIYTFYTGDLGRQNYSSQSINGGVQLSF